MRFKSKILYGIPIIMFAIDSDYKIQYKNEEFMSYFGRSKSKHIGGIINCENYKVGVGCTKTAKCGACELRKALYDCIELKKVVHKRLIQKEVVLNGKSKELNLRISVKKIETEQKEYGVKDLYVCLIDDIVEVSQEKREEFNIDRKLLHDLKKASSMQSEMLPIKSSVNGIDFDYIYNQCFPVGGDFLNVYELGGDFLGGFVADVSGHGMSSGLLTMFLNEVYDKSLKEPLAILKGVQEEFEKFRFSSNEYITMLVFVIDLKNRTITFSNAGHTTPLTILRKGKVKEYTINGTPVSTWFNKYNFEEATIQYNEGDKLVLYTDGATDLKNHKGEQFGTKRLLELFKKGEDIHSMIENINSELVDFSKQLEDKTDDITVLALQLN